MTGISKDYITGYLRGLYENNDPFLTELRRYAEENEIPIIERESLAVLELMVAMKKPKEILEIGTAIGYSTIAMAKSFDKSIIRTIDIDEENLSIAIRNIKKAGLEDRVKFSWGDAGDILDELEGKYDLVFIDAAKSHYRHYFEACLKITNEDAVIISDNVLFKGLIANDDLVNRRARTLVRHMRDYLEFLTHSDDFKTAVLPVGDGIAITQLGFKKE
ncbi:MAG: O-methyltransferase [Tissierellia bacterium]|nr:O-methyltransferase [Tissierellia bacterium]